MLLIRNADNEIVNFEKFDVLALEIETRELKEFCSVVVKRYNPDGQHCDNKGYGQRYEKVYIAADYPSREEAQELIDYIVFNWESSPEDVADVNQKISAQDKAREKARREAKAVQS